MEIASHEKIVIVDPDFPVVVLENDKVSLPHRQQLCALHWHEHLELHYIFDGELEICVNQTLSVLNRGDMVIINSSDTHTSYYSGRLKERILIFNLKDLSPKLSQTAPVFQRIIRQDSFVREKLMDFEAEYAAKAVGYEAACKASVLQLMVYLTRNYILTHDSELEYHKHARQLQRLRPVLEFINAHFAESITSELLSNMIYVSKDRFNHLFKACMGIPLRKYINDIRLHNAYSWLENGQYSAAEAASRSGFTDYNHFGRLFRQTFGCTPTAILPETAK